MQVETFESYNLKILKGLINAWLEENEWQAKNIEFHYSTSSETAAEGSRLITTYSCLIAYQSL